MILGLFPELGGLGGVQHASRHIAAVIAGYAAARGWPCLLLSLNDPTGRHTAEVGGRSFTYEGFSRRKARFSTAAVSARPRAVFAAHPHLAPVAWLVKKTAGARMAVVGHGVEIWGPLPRFRLSALRAADLFLAVSTFTGEQAVRVHGVARQAVRMIPLAVDPSLAESAGNCAGLPRPAFWPAGRTLLSVARLAASEGYKGVDRVIEVLPRVRERAGNVHYVVVGDGDDLARHRRLAAERGVGDSVHFVGRLPAMSSELLGCYAHCDAFVLPSKGEGFGLVFLEAMIFGKPAIGGAHGGTPDVIEDGSSGYLVDHDDRDQLAARLITVLTDDALYARMGREARGRVQSSFLFRHFEQRLTGYLDELCAS